MVNLVNLDVQIVGSEDQLEQSALVHLEEVSVPGADVVCSLLLVLVILGQRGIVLVVSGPLKHLLQDGGVNIGKWNGLVVILARAKVIQQLLDGHTLLGDLYVHRELLAVRGYQLNGGHCRNLC